jgi:hypothetical protein
MEGRPMSSLSELIDRVVAATGPERRIDAAICRIIDLPKCEYPDCLPDVMVRILDRVESGGDDPEVPAYTGSLDAALTLLPEGWEWELSWIYGRACAKLGDPLLSIDCDGSTPALALVAACLKARLLDAASSEAR